MSAVAPRVVYEPLQRDERTDGVRITNSQLLGVMAGILLIGDSRFIVCSARFFIVPYSQRWSLAPSKARSYNSRYVYASDASNDHC